MDIKITAKNIKLTPAIKEYIHTRVSKVENFFDNIVSAFWLIFFSTEISTWAETMLSKKFSTLLTRVLIYSLIAGVNLMFLAVILISINSSV